MRFMFSFINWKNSRPGRSTGPLRSHRAPFAKLSWHFSGFPTFLWTAFIFSSNLLCFCSLAWRSAFYFLASSSCWTMFWLLRVWCVCVVPAVAMLSDMYSCVVGKLSLFSSNFFTFCFQQFFHTFLTFLIKRFSIFFNIIHSDLKNISV